ncbi:MAG: hypothetical protein GC162_04840 [Planctomycetes bacterium]|nr:hypothetical protein [Planctomycetota bacterium]
MTTFTQRIMTVLAIALTLALAGRASAGVYAYYSFDNDYTDGSTNHHTGVPTDGNANSNTTGVNITHTAGEFMFGGGAANFSTDYLSITSHTFNSGSPYTIAFWARDLAPAGNSGGMVIGQPGNSTFFIWLDSSIAGGGGLRWRSNSTSATDRNADFNFTNDTNWHHYAVIASGTNLSVYRDAGLVATATGKSTGFIMAAIGQAYNNNALNFNGQIDEMWILDEAIAPSQVNSLFLTNVVPAPAALPAGLALMGLLISRRRAGM